ncbi:MAG: glycosyltransferase family 1 protein [Winogradskyella sp.]|uniref:glycosyltransferase family 4 protein n=1 Tax=Winogradskyella sp. TaxID=1883156 RepID=UPI000F40D0CE|nr:glycosyltransferase family 4 protein [Winogradskyella sp.]RNC86895.1 MAG: glycosyltransferase family 1 protein [Winogradskyella sp.]
MSIPKKHIVLLTSEFPPLPGGIGNHALNLAEYLSESGYKVSVIADQRDTRSKEAEFDNILKSNIYRVAKKRFRSLMYLKRIWICYKLSKKADVLVCSGKFPLWVGAFLKSLVKAETIAVIHGTEVNFSNPRLRTSVDNSLRRYYKVIAVSNYTKSLVDHLLLKNIRVIPNGFSISKGDSKLSEALVLSGSPKLLTVGNVTERKGQAEVIKHLPKVLEQYPNAHYHCIGFKTEADQCLALAKSLNVSKHITFHGHVSHSELVNFYSVSDISVMLSQTTKTGDVEGFGIALIEANYFGLPTIGSKGCGIEDAISDGKSGLLINASHTTEFINAMDRILDNRDEFEAESKLWAERHQWKNIIQRYIDYIEL